MISKLLTKISLTFSLLSVLGLFVLISPKEACAEATRVYGKAYMTIDGEEILLPGVVLYREDNPGKPGNPKLPSVCVRDNGPVGTYAVTETEWYPGTTQNYFFRNSFEGYNWTGPSLNFSSISYYDCDKRKEGTVKERYSSLGINPGGDPASNSQKNDSFCPEDNPPVTASCFKFGTDDAEFGYYAGGLSCGDGSPQYMLAYFPKRTILGTTQTCNQSGGVWSCDTKAEGATTAQEISTEVYFQQNYPYIDFNANDPKGGGTWDANCISQSNPKQLKCRNNTFNWQFTSNRFSTTSYAPAETIYTLNNDNVGSMIIDWEWTPSLEEEPTCPNGVVDTGEECDPGSTSSAVCSREGFVGACQSDCSCGYVPQAPECGDGNMDAGEECDPGDDDTATCSNGESCTDSCSCPDSENPSIGKIADDECSATNDSSTVTYTVTVTNPTNVAITATVTDTLDADLDVSTIQTSTISDDGTLTGHVITWEDLTIAANSTVTLTYDVIFPDDDFETEFTNTARLIIDDTVEDEATFNITPDCEGTIPETGIEDSPVFSILMIGLGFGMFIIVSSEIMYGNISAALGKKYNLVGLLYQLSPKKDKEMYEEAVQYKKPETKDLYKKKRKRKKE
jgi:hypothetical protein